jgi:Basic region leucine zipper
MQPSKKARSRKASVSSPPAEEIGLAGVSAAEDKRRRNTAASARFRLKKKEREAALEGKAKELEVKVSELERECEALRRENGWLKGLVVGVTGAAQGPVPPPLIGSPQSMQNMTASSTSSGKRRREDGDNA